MAPTCPTRPRRPRPPVDLQQLVESVLDALDEPVGALLGVLAAPGEDVELAVRRSGPGGPFAELLGWSAPDDWWAVGLVAPATAHFPTASGDAHVALLVGRTGEVACALRQDRAPAASLGPGGHGRLLDACRRALGMPTPPPARPVGELWLQCWLDRLVAALAAGAVPDPTEATALHPLVPLLVPGRADLTGLADLARHAVASTTWAELRELAIAGLGRNLVPAVGGELATWMDEGMFARWCSSRFPAAGELLGAVADLAPAALTRRVTRVARAWGCGPPGPWEAADPLR